MIGNEHNHIVSSYPQFRQGKPSPLVSQLPPSRTSFKTSSRPENLLKFSLKLAAISNKGWGKNQTYSVLITEKCICKLKKLNIGISTRASLSKTLPPEFSQNYWKLPIPLGSDFSKIYSLSKKGERTYLS